MPTIALPSVALPVFNAASDSPLELAVDGVVVVILVLVR